MDVPQRLEPAERKQLERLRDSLLERGLLSDAKTLTPAGKAVARALTWAFEIRTLTTAIGGIQRCVDRGDCLDDGLVPEPLIAGHRWGLDPGPFALLQAMFQPLLADGVLVAESSCQGHTYYRLADSPGDTKQAIRSLLADGVEFDGGLCDAYLAEYRRARRRLLTSKVTSQDIGLCPLPVSLELTSGRDLDDVPKPLFPLTK